MFFNAKKPAPHVELALWMLRKAIQSLPAVLLPKALDALDALLDPDTPAWRRALIATFLLEVVAVLNIQVPLAVVIRFSVLRAAFGAGRARGYHARGG